MMYVVPESILRLRIIGYGIIMVYSDIVKFCYMVLKHVPFIEETQLSVHW